MCSMLKSACDKSGETAVRQRCIVFSALRQTVIIVRSNKKALVLNEAPDYKSRNQHGWACGEPDRHR